MIVSIINLKKIWNIFSEYRSKRHVSTLRFVLFLYCQSLSSQKLRNSSFSENWPSSSLPSARDKQSRNVEKIIDNLDNLLLLCSKPATEENVINSEGLKGV